ncbi:MAG: short-chain dehydrogenase/reductase [Pseudonocardia sediminis]
MSHHPVAGRTVLITGAAGGIGTATARALHARGARVVLTDRTRDDVAPLAAELGSRALAVAADVTDHDSVRAAVDAAVAEFGSLDVVFANAGIAGRPSTVAAGDPDEFERVVDVDLLGVWRTVRAALPHVIAARGYVLCCASIYGFVNGVVNTPYAMSKAGVEQLGRALRVELAIHGASAGVLAPGWIRTPIADVAFGGDPLVSALRRRAYPGPLGNAISPDRVATAVVRGIEGRAARIVVPRRWAPVSALRGLVNPVLDGWLERDATIQDAIRKLDEPRRP